MADSFVKIEQGEEPVVRAGGRIDFSMSEELFEALSRAIECRGKVLIDLSAAEMLDSSAIASLAAAYRQAEAAGVGIAIAAASRDALHALQMSGLASSLGLPAVEGGSNGLTRDRPDLRRQDWQITESVALAEADLIAPLQDLAATAACEAGLDSDSVADVTLAVTEALTNALRHGSPCAGMSRIRLRCLACARAFVVEVTDEGAGVSPVVVQQANEWSGEAGIGLRLMQRAMDEVEFSHDEHGGRVRMVKWLPA